MTAVGGMRARVLALAAAGLPLVSACRLNPAFDEGSTGSSGSSASSDTDGDSGPGPTGTDGGTDGNTDETGSGGVTGGGSSTSEDGGGSTSEDGGSSTGGDSSSSDGSGTSTGSDSSTSGQSSTSEDVCSDPPDFPDPGGPYEELTVANAELDNTGEPWLAVEPGQMVELRFDYETNICSCPDCIVQGVVGFVEDSWRDCFYEGIPGCGGVQSQAVITFAAPLEPGEYTLSFDRTLEFSCQPDLAGLPPERAFAGVCVHD